MAVVTAKCTNCRDEHRLADRSPVPGTTACPSCDDTSYRTECEEREGGNPPTPARERGDRAGAEPPKADADRIRDAVRDVDGVGSETLERIVARYGLYAELESASAEELTEIKNVGQTVAERIQENV